MNKVILLGRLTKNVEVRYTQDNTLIANFTLAVNRSFKGKDGERKQQADFINIQAWSKLGEFCSKYFQKGQQVCVVGSLRNRSWEDDTGKRHYITEVRANEAYFADSKKGDRVEPDRGDAFEPTAELHFSNESDDELPF